MIGSSVSVSMLQAPTSWSAVAVALVATALSLYSPARGEGQVKPLGSEIQINTYTSGAQRFPLAAMNAGGDFIVVWESDGQDGSLHGAFGRRYTSAGAALGSEMQLNSYTSNEQRVPAVAADADGDFVVVWSSLDQDGSSYGVFGQRYTSSGTAIGTELLINSSTAGSQRASSIAADADGDFVVVWRSDDGSSDGVFAQRHASTGAEVGTEFRVNSYTTSQQGAAEVATDADGDFVVIWISTGQDGSSAGVFGQLYASTGAAVGSEFQVNTHTTSSQSEADVAMDADGDFVVVWHSYNSGPGYGVFGQRFASTGAPVGTEFQINTYGTHDQQIPSVAMSPDGDFVVVWQSYGQDGMAHGVFGQRYASTGTPLGTEFKANTYTPNDQEFATVVADAAGGFVILWHSVGQDGSSYGVFAQRYGVACPSTPSSTCGGSSKGKLLVKDDASDDLKDTLRWKWGKGSGAPTQSAFGDPAGGDSVRFCLYDDAALKLDTLVAGGSLWSNVSGKGWKYKDPNAGVAGISKLILKSGPDGKAKISVKGKGEALALPPPAGAQYFAQTTSVTAQLHAANGNCWQTVFTDAQTTNNESHQFKTKF